MPPSHATLLALLGYIFLQNARPDKAVTVLAALDIVQPAQAQVLRALAVAQLRCGQHASTLETLDRLAMAGGADASFHLLRTRALLSAQRKQEADAALRMYLEMRGSPPVHETSGAA